MRRERTRERGAVLLGVLISVAALATLATATLGDMRTMTERGTMAREADQALWYALGIERMAATVLRRSRLANDGRDTAADAFLRGPMHFPVEGGFIEARIADGGNCFNLNSLVRGTPGGTLEADPDAVERFVRLMQRLDIDENDARAIAAAAADWIDSDSRPGPQGAEDAAYLGLAVPTRTANTLMAEAAELRGVAGVDAGLWERLQPFICALPTTEPATLNINTLLPGQAPLLLMLADRKLGETAARAAIEDRPREGYASVAAMLDRPALRGAFEDEAARARLGISTRYYALEALVSWQERRLELHALYEVRGDEVRHLRRSFGGGV